MNLKKPEICQLNEIHALKDDLGYKRILIVKPSSLGDILHAFPAFYLLRKSLPTARIDWLVSSNLSMLLAFVRKDLGKIINFRRNEFRETTHTPKALYDLVTTLRSTRYDLIIDMQGLMRSSLMTFISRARHKAGFADLKEKMSGLFYNIKVHTPEGMTHAIEKNCYLISEILGIECRIPDFVLPVSSNIDIRERLAPYGVDKNEKFIAISPAARWKTKTWPPEFFAGIADAVSERFPEKKIIILGSKSENETAKRVIAACRGKNPVNLAGLTNMNELVELIRDSEIFITNDSGPMHIAALMRVPVFAFFGPTDPEKTGPYWPWHKVYQSDSGCIKCMKRKCIRPTLECQSNVSVKTVIDDILKKLKGEA